jgi:hypothetical protein
LLVTVKIGVRNKIRPLADGSAVRQANDVVVKTYILRKAGMRNVNAGQFPSSKTSLQQLVGTLFEKGQFPNVIDGHRLRLVLGTKCPFCSQIESILRWAIKPFGILIERIRD